jgi:uncharacterized membrane protein YdjX (TVP38/TMEM64 family)
MPASKDTTRYPVDNTYSFTSLSSTTKVGVDDDMRYSRTPSPTPSELEALKSGALDWKTLSHWRFWIRKDWIRTFLYCFACLHYGRLTGFYRKVYYIVFIIVVAVTALSTIYHTQIVHWLTPVAKWMHDLRFGYLIPIAILFVISFPPLFGHEIVAVICGLVWGLGVGFAIVAAGTLLGEIGNFYAFKYCCRARGEKLEKTKLFYACLARVVRDGGFTIALIARLSAIPGHFTTALFASCGMNIFVFILAALLSTPKQFITVYLGVILEESSTGGNTSTTRKIISDAVVGVTLLVTIGAMWFIVHKMNKVKPTIIYERRKARQAKLARVDFGPYGNVDAASSGTFDPRSSDSDIPLNPSKEHGSPYHQQWDKQGRAVGYAPDPQLYAPQPKRYSAQPIAGQIPAHGDEFSAESRYGDVPGQGPRSPPGLSHPAESQPGPKLSQDRDMTTPTQDHYGMDRQHPADSFEYLPTQAYSSSSYHGHTAAASDDSFHTAYGGHSKPGTEMNPSQPTFSPPSDLR